MSITCLCEDGSSNTGTTGKELDFHDIRLTLVSQRYADDGTRNEIDLSTLTDGKFTTQDIIDLQNQSDPSKRWYVLGQFQNGEIPVPDLIDETLAGGATVNVSANPYSFTGQLYKRTPYQIANMQHLACNDIQAVFIDGCGSVMGETDSRSEPTKLYGIPLNKDAFTAQFMFGNRTEASKAMLRLEFDQLAKVGYWAYTLSDDLDLFAVQNGVQDALVTNVTSATTTELVFDLGFPIGNSTANSPLVGLASTDLELVNVTADTVVPLAGLTESATVKGRYTATFAAQTASDVVYLKSADTAGVFNKTGFEVLENRQTLA